MILCISGVVLFEQISNVIESMLPYLLSMN